MIVLYIFGALCFACNLGPSIINDYPFIASDKWTQKHTAYCIVLGSLHTSISIMISLVEGLQISLSLQHLSFELGP